MIYPYSEQLREVRREIAYRQRMYPQRVADRKMTQTQADRHMALMQAVAETLEPLARSEELPGLAPPA